MTIDTKSRHRAKAGGDVFLDLGFSPQEAKGLLAQADAQIEESIRLKRQLLVGTALRGRARWMRCAHPAWWACSPAHLIWRPAASAS